MNPFFVRNRIQRYLDHELSEQERLEMEQALEEHPNILEEVQELEAQRLFLSEYGIKKAPKDLLTNILDEIEEEPLPIPTKRTAANNFRWYLLSAVALALFAVFLPSNPTKKLDQEINVKSARSLPIPNIIELPPREPAKTERTAPAKTTTETTSKTPKTESTTSTKNTTRSPRSSRPQQLNFVIGTPENPYAATWEETTTHTIEPVISKAHPDSYQIRMAPEDILFRLQSLAQSTGGQLISAKGKTLSPFHLNSENGFQTVKIVVPQENYSTIDENLRQLGGTTSLETLPIENGQVSFPIVVYYQFY